MPASEYIGWQAFYSIFPFSEERADIRNALLCMVVANTSGNLKRATKMTDFLPNYIEPVRGKSLEQQRREFSAFVSELNAAKAYARGEG